MEKSKIKFINFRLFPIIILIIFILGFYYIGELNEGFVGIIIGLVIGFILLLAIYLYLKYLKK